MRRPFVLLMLSVSMMLISSSVWSADIPAVEWKDDPQFNYSNGPYMMGYEFDVTSPVIVTALGAYDQYGDGFVSTHTVGLWTLGGGTLLTSGIVDNSDPLDGHFRYTSVTPIALAVGTYVVGASDWGAEGDVWAWENAGQMGLIDAPGITFVQDKWLYTSGFAYPLNTEGGIDGFFGGNFKVSSGVPSGVPEPTSLLLLGTGLGVIGLAAWRRRK